MYKNKTENVEVYFICYKKEEMDLIETYYDEVLDTHCWYINAYLAYKEWKTKFKKSKAKKMTKTLLIVAASRYLLYLIENNEFKSDSEYQEVLNDLSKIDLELEKIMSNDQVFKN